MNVVDLIVAKRNREHLSPEQIRQLVDEYTAGNVPDYQLSAFLMASFLNGMNADESFALAESMLYSGSVLDLSDIPGIKVDKHSTGGVGDKISILLAPIVAAAGVPVPMISGRGLGHTGGTLDKLESIPGFRTDFSIAEYRQQLADIGIVMIGQTAEIAPADRKLYALRDVTGTVEFIPFIAASIMSKKLAEGIDALVLDVKWGRGAFMKSEEDARELAERLVSLGEKFGKKTVAWLTDMNEPLGYGIGNWPETEEAIQCLRGKDVADVLELTFALAGEMIWLGGKAGSPSEGIRIAKETISTGSAFEKLVQLVEAQGGDVEAIRSPETRNSKMPSHSVMVPKDWAGRIESIDPYLIGKLAVSLGAGRLKVTDAVDPLAGITLVAKTGDVVKPGQVLARLHTTHIGNIADFESSLLSAYQIGDAGTKKGSLLVSRLSDGKWTESADSN